MCLLCGNVFCETCDQGGKHKEEVHKGSWLVFLFRAAAIIIQAKDKYDVIHLYLNEFLMPYEMKDSCGEGEVFKLSESNLSKAVDDFLNAA